MPSAFKSQSSCAFSRSRELKRRLNHLQVADVICEQKHERCIERGAFLVGEVAMKLDDCAIGKVRIGKRIVKF